MKKSKKPIKPMEKETEEIVSPDKTAMTESTNDQHPPGRPDRTGSTLNSQPSTKNMEVHHHGHVHETKKWKEYIFQFLMLFLAVFCGFLAEYQLEHVIERDREKQFIISLISDLQDDEKILADMTALDQFGMASIDTLIDLLNNPALAKQQGDQLYFAARMGPRYIPFANNSRTFDQLKFSGGFRLIRNTKASNKIMAYYNKFPVIRLMEDNYSHEFDNYKRTGARILDPGILKRQESNNGVILRSNDNPALRTYDPELLKELGFHALQMNGSRRSKLPMLENLKKEGNELINFLTKEYHLD